jgi:hypothetical protein
MKKERSDWFTFSCDLLRFLCFDRHPVRQSFGDGGSFSEGGSLGVGGFLLGSLQSKPTRMSGIKGQVIDDAERLRCQVMQNSWSELGA